MKKAALLLGLLVACIRPAFANGAYIDPDFVKESPYIGVDYVINTLTVRDAELEMSAGRFRIGTEFNRYLGVEYQATIGFDDDEAPVLGGIVHTRVKAATGVYARGKLPFGNVGGIYGLVGYSWSWIEVDAQAFGLMDRTYTDDDLSAGVGIEFGSPKKAFFNVEYIEFTEGLTAFAAGVRIPF
ncbi:MAG: hypothetical protein K0R03_2092 [Moraxellaceae bacterium]|jgi:hypothetical protein|nr:hypothetical protein [Moraxellaceae bacterium]